jgi:hypothetical protein
VTELAKRWRRKGERRAAASALAGPDAGQSMVDIDAVVADATRTVPPRSSFIGLPSCCDPGSSSPSTVYHRKWLRYRDWGLFLAAALLAAVGRDPCGCVNILR